METQTKFKIGQPLERIATDYTAGRMGTVVAIQPADPVKGKPTRYQVRWTKERDGSPISKGNKPLANGLKTWVRELDLKAVSPVDSMREQAENAFADEETAETEE